MEIVAGQVWGANLSDFVVQVTRVEGGRAYYVIKFKSARPDFAESSFDYATFKGLMNTSYKLHSGGVELSEEDFKELI